MTMIVVSPSLSPFHPKLWNLPFFQPPSPPPTFGGERPRWIEECHWGLVAEVNQDHHFRRCPRGYSSRNLQRHPRRRSKYQTCRSTKLRGSPLLLPLQRLLSQKREGRQR